MQSVARLVDAVTLDVVGKGKSCAAGKEFGKISRITPNKASPSGFVLENSTSAYQFTTDAADRFLDKGFDVDDYVMLTFDREEKVADVILVDYELYKRFADDDLDLLDEVNRSISKPIIVADDSYANKCYRRNKFLHISSPE